MIEHNLEVIKCADWIIDLGPEAGDEGGKWSRPERRKQVAKIEASHTGTISARRLWGAQRPRAVASDSQGIARCAMLDDGDEISLRAAEEPLGELPIGQREAPRFPDASATTPSASTARASTI